MANTSRPVNSVAEMNRAASSFGGSLSYPINRPLKHGMVFVFRSYDYSSVDRVIKPAGRVGGSVALPLPTNIQDSYDVNISQFELGATSALAADLLTGNTSGLQSDIRSLANLAGDQNLPSGTSASELGQAGTALLQTLKAAGAFAGRNLLDTIGLDGISAGIDVAGGTVVNPHVALRFEGVNLKQHSFEWTLSPQSQDEAAALKAIANRIRTAASPSYAMGGGSSSLSRALLNYPDLVDIWFVGLDQSYFYYFKPAMIQNFSVNFSPNGIALAKGGKPAVVSMSMTLTEASVNTREDFAQY
jgi:hypothetical protein